MPLEKTLVAVNCIQIKFDPKMPVIPVIHDDDIEAGKGGPTNNGDIRRSSLGTLSAAAFRNTLKSINNQNSCVYITDKGLRSRTNRLSLINNSNSGEGHQVGFQRPRSTASVHSSLVENVQLDNITPQNRCSDNNANQNTNDGRRRVDFILVYQKGNKPEDMVAHEARNVFEANLKEEGLELEYTNDRARTGLTFVKLHATWELLSR